MKRREFIIGGAAAAWPFAARTQQPTMPVVGFLHSASPGPYRHLIAAFSQGLREVGYFEGRNVSIEYRWAEGQFDRLPALAADLVQRRVAAIGAFGGNAAPNAAKTARLSRPTIRILQRTPPAVIIRQFLAMQMGAYFS